MSAARGALATGDKAAALEHIEAALLIDPEFLAARMLRERVTSGAQDMSFTSSVAERIDLVDTPAPASAPAAVPPPVTVSPETLANFQERVMRRVREREAAAGRRASTQRGKVAAQRGKVAWTALFAAAAGFLAAMSSTTLYEPNVLHSRSIAMSAPLVALEAPEPLTTPTVPDRPAEVLPDVRVPVRAASTAVAMRGIVDLPPEPVRVPSPPPTPPAPTTTTAPPSGQPAAQPATSTVARGVQALPPRSVPDIVASSPAPAPAPAVVPVSLVSTSDDRALVDQALQSYRRAYNRLDARSAHAIYPAVNEPALARAFENLESQALLFETCQIDVQGSSAYVMCRGSSHYVPKVGNHETRVERRIWNFTLRKDDGDWKIENARAAR